MRRTGNVKREPKFGDAVRRVFDIMEPDADELAVLQYIDALDNFYRQPRSVGSIASIIADGYDIGVSTHNIAEAVYAYVTRGEPNPFEAEADALHHRLESEE